MAKIFVFDGVNGTGKTTLINELKNKFIIEYPDYKILSFYTPGCGIKEIRDIFKNPNYKFSALTRLFLISSDFNELINNHIIPVYDDDKCIILLDRLYDSTYVYQGVLGKLDLKKISDTIDWCMKDIKINHTFILDIQYEVSEDRRSGERFRDSYEKDFSNTFDIIRNAYIERCKLNNYTYVDTNRDLNELIEFLYDEIKKRII